MSQDQDDKAGQQLTWPYFSPKKWREHLYQQSTTSGTSFILPHGVDTTPQLEIEPSTELQAKRKAEGRCVHCGELLPMSAMGLGDCKVCS
jgi:hypothetical protein